MSADTQTPDLGLNVGYSRNVNKKGEEEEESRVEIYENEVTLQHSHIDIWSHGVRPATQNIHPDAKRSHCKHVGILGVLYLLILAGIFMRYILAMMEFQKAVTERDQLNTSLIEAQTKNNNLTKERDELQGTYDTLAKNHSNLQEENRRLKEILRSCLAEITALDTQQLFPV